MQLDQMKKEGRCFFCMEKGHLRRDCPKEGKGKMAIRRMIEEMTDEERKETKEQVLRDMTEEDRNELRRMLFSPSDFQNGVQ